jgi:rare lipoprotein A (peptidoglycan hydrolase)
MVRVSANGKAVRVRLTDRCACGSRNGVPTLIDLDVRSFEVLAPRSVGVLRVVVEPIAIPAPPETSTEP